MTQLNKMDEESFRIILREMHSRSVDVGKIKNIKMIESLDEIHNGDWVIERFIGPFSSYGIYIKRIDRIDPCTVQVREGIYYGIGQSVWFPDFEDEYIIPGIMEWLDIRQESIDKKLCYKVKS